jgi:hypothetical protein
MENTERMGPYSGICQGYKGLETTVARSWSHGSWGELRLSGCRAVGGRNVISWRQQAAQQVKVLRHEAAARGVLWRRFSRLADIVIGFEAALQPDDKTCG